MNYICFNGLFSLHYAYIDSHNYLADSLFNKRDIPVKFGDEMVRQGDKYRIIFCKVKKKYKEQFEKAMQELTNKMLLCGYTDYEEFCKKFKEEVYEEE